jgi:hypothetical protein
MSPPYETRSVAGSLLVLFRRGGDLQYLMLAPSAHWIWRKLESGWPVERVLAGYQRRHARSARVARTDVAEVAREFRKISSVGPAPER